VNTTVIWDDIADIRHYKYSISMAFLDGHVGIGWIVMSQGVLWR
jgi:prepilin-type processing-associated H-X9-DG protein